MSDKRSLFVYGTLIFDGVLQSLLGYIPNKLAVQVDGFKVVTIHLEGWQPFPVMMEAPLNDDNTVSGYILSGLTELDFIKLDRYEYVHEAYYVRKQLQATTGELADYYEPADKLFDVGTLGEPWDVETLDPLLESIYVDSVVPEFKQQNPDIF